MPIIIAAGLAPAGGKSRRSKARPFATAALLALGLALGIAGAPSAALAQFVCQTLPGGGGASATATGTTSIACGPFAKASGEISSAFGNSSEASGVRSSAYGNNSTASGNVSSAYGDNSSATGEQSSAFGFASRATGDFSSAHGAASTASGDFSSAYGTLSKASGDQSTALGFGAEATHANSTAIGAEAKTTRDNQIMFGKGTTTYTMAGITSDASKTAQGAPTHIVTSNAAGDLAAHTIADLGLAKLTDIGGLQTQINKLGERDRELADGIAISVAMAQPILLSGQSFGLRVGYGNFDGSSAMGLSAAGVLSRGFSGPTSSLVVDAGLGFGTETSMTAGRAGVTFGW